MNKIEKEASWRALRDQMPKRPREDYKRERAHITDKRSAAKSYVNGKDFKNESKNMNKKQTIKLTESELHRIIKESVNMILREENNGINNINTPYERYKDEDYPMEDLSPSSKKVYIWCMKVLDEMRNSGDPLYDTLENFPADGLTLAEAEEVCAITDNYVSGARMIFSSGQSDENNDTIDYRIVKLLQQNRG